MNEAAASPKLEQIVVASARVLAMWGLSRTKVQDIAATAGVAPGTIYLYADSKESLFDMALRYGLGMKTDHLADYKLPYSTTKVETLNWLRQVATLENLLPQFLDESLLALPLVDLFEGLFDFLATHRFAVRIVERSAHEWQELAVVFFQQIRDPVIKRIGQRIQHENPSMEKPECLGLARLVGGSIAFASVHRHFEGGEADPTSEAIYRKVTVESLLRMINRDQESS